VTEARRIGASLHGVGVVCALRHASLLEPRRCSAKRAVFPLMGRRPWSTRGTRRRQAAGYPGAVPVLGQSQVHPGDPAPRISPRVHVEGFNPLQQFQTPHRVIQDRGPSVLLRWPCIGVPQGAADRPRNGTCPEWYTLLRRSSARKPH